MPGRQPAANETEPQSRPLQRQQTGDPTSNQNFDIIGHGPHFCGMPERPTPKAPAASPRVRKATTVRLDPQLQEGLMLLQAVLEKPLNRMVNEAVRRFIETRTAEVESDLQQVLTRVRAYRRSNPNFENAIAQFVSAEASLASNDPVEGSTQASTGPAPSVVHELLRG